ncbi:Gfo/Idh/MocA family protein [Saccharibacillus sp. JS10]|uniref:Gfo/Idh/MocA family protein n=1 Tax=Saccharibacillus sp. JS10 TaxID=2950552 RepID=UPI00210AC1EE|nr:Gfo/Idh/MocA family oxidoreductase [Saccharibacillus sp. JS10]MCQ4085252.1 Gfo/Idh/MocA family oxidoreductase [Saccharibacillus sp. JS10]
MNKKLRWGVVGTAAIAEHAFIPATQQSELGLVQAIASRDESKAQEMAQRLGIERYYGSYEQLIDDPDIDALYIPLPNHLHREWAIRGAQAGKHILCEKPASLNTQETIEMVEACRENGVCFAEAFMYRYSDKHRRVREIMDSGEIGDIRFMRGVFNYCTPDDTGNVRFHQAMGGGSIYDIGVYPISAARMIMQSEPLWASAHAFFSPEHDHVDMAASGLLAFPGGISLMFECSMWAYNRSFFEITGTKGRIELPFMFGWRENPQIIVDTDQEHREEKIHGINHYILQSDHFARAVFGEQELPYSAEDAVHNMKLVEACIRSAREGVQIKI